MINVYIISPKLKKSLYKAFNIFCTNINFFHYKIIDYNQDLSFIKNEDIVIFAFQIKKKEHNSFYLLRQKHSIALERTFLIQSISDIFKDKEQLKNLFNIIVEIKQKYFHSLEIEIATDIFNEFRTVLLDYIKNFDKKQNKSYIFKTEDEKIIEIRPDSILKSNNADYSLTFGELFIILATRKIFDIKQLFIIEDCVLEKDDDQTS